jgi:hypothetical protein
VDYSASGCHELEVSGLNCALVSGKVFVVDCAGQEVGDGFLAAVGIFCMSAYTCVIQVEILTIWEACTGWNSKVVEHKEGTEVSQLWCSYASSNSRACTFRLFDRKERLGNLAGCRCR